MRRNRFIRILKILPLVLVFAALFGLVVMSLWNWLMPQLFGLKAIGYWQAFGILILSRILFGGFRGGSGVSSWRHRMMERCAQMTPEERERFRQTFQARWGQASSSESAPTP